MLRAMLVDCQAMLRQVSSQTLQHKVIIISLTLLHYACLICVSTSDLTVCLLKSFHLSEGGGVGWVGEARGTGRRGKRGDPP